MEYKNRVEGLPECENEDIHISYLESLVTKQSSNSVFDVLGENETAIFREYSQLYLKTSDHIKGNIQDIVKFFEGCEERKGDIYVNKMNAIKKIWVDDMSKYCQLLYEVKISGNSIEDNESMEELRSFNYNQQKKLFKVLRNMVRKLHYAVDKALGKQTRSQKKKRGAGNKT